MGALYASQPIQVDDTAKLVLDAIMKDSSVQLWTNLDDTVAK